MLLADGGDDEEEEEIEFNFDEVEEFGDSDEEVNTKNKLKTALFALTMFETG